VKTELFKEVAYKILVMASFTLIVLFCIYNFLFSVLETSNGILNNLEKINFNKGSFYLFGVAVGLIDLMWIMVYQGVLKRALTKKVTKLFSRIAIISLITTFTLPIIGHLVIDELVESKGYKACAPAGNTWFYLSEIVYFDSTVICEE
jgi:hypothetical protein